MESKSDDATKKNSGEEMNRIILIGNGFDLAHGLKTLYHNFIKNLCRKKLVPFSKSEALLPLESTKQSVNAFVIDNFVKVERPNNKKYTLLKNRTEKEIQQDFYIGIYPVTQKSWEDLMKYNPSYFQGDVLSGKDNNNLPVETVSWYDAILFCNKLSEKYNLDIYYNINGEDITINVDAKGFRLPNEAEWEYAARSGKHNENLDYSGSNTIDEVAWYYENSGENKLDEPEWGYLDKSKCCTHVVGTKKPNALGIYDMSGNVWEWCNDEEGSFRVLRGGSWYSYAKLCHVSLRYNFAPGFRNDFVGFRLVLPL
ncbi:hypothetical protein AGMMS49574_12150 [Bacteroidia bacterium]|nr:hypothetical protein AGMMS49574_12150 [Bacteroidia bacterium]